MKIRFNTFDIVCGVAELQRLVGMRVNNVYDIDNKTYLIKLQRPKKNAYYFWNLATDFTRQHTNGEECSAVRLQYEAEKTFEKQETGKHEAAWHRQNCRFAIWKREAAYHVILELYDRGNIILTDYELNILNILRPHTEGDKVKFVVKEKYPQDRARESASLTLEDVKGLLENAKDGDNLKKILLPKLEFGPSLIEHVLLKHGFSNSTKIGKNFNVTSDIPKLFEAIQEAEGILNEGRNGQSKGYITQKKEQRPSTEENKEQEYFFSNQEFHPYLFLQHEGAPYKTYDSFNQAVDEFFSTLQGQKIDLKQIQQEREAIKKLENVKKDHSQRLIALEKTQETDKTKAELITKNQELVDNAILAIQSALANQMTWSDIETLVKEAALRGEPVAKQIKQLKLNTNHITLLLSDPYTDEDTKQAPCLVDIDLALTAFSNARRYYDQKRSAAKKQQKTIESQSKAFKSAEKKTKQALKDMKTTTNINKARKVYWFEKFFWFISSENYLVIGGRDQQQNELIVKRYMKPKDVYVHADIHGASSIIIKNPSGLPITPKTLNEAGTMAICYSVAWEAKVLTEAYWVYGEQVSKTAPAGEYLTTGSFMIRGKKNFLPPSHLILGLGFLFRLEDSSVERHKGERKVMPITSEGTVEEDKSGDSLKDDEEIIVSEDSEDEDPSPSIQEEGNEDHFAPIQEEGSDEVEDSKEKPANEISNIPKQVSKEETDDSSSEEENPSFPDTQIKIKHLKELETTAMLKDLNQENKLDTEERLQKAKQRSRTNSENSIKNKVEQQKEDKRQIQMKRGQRSKLKKIKEKYKDQDEEERELRMNILQSAGPTSKRNKKSGKQQNEQPKQAPKVKIQKPKQEDIGDIDDEPVVQADVDMIDALTGLPVIEDELLFAVPVVAPYNTLSQYKFKVKLTPGTSKRGKAAKTAVNMFLHDKTTSPREKDLLKAVKDELLARNIPGKVKLSAPRMQILRK